MKLFQSTRENTVFFSKCFVKLPSCAKDHHAYFTRIRFHVFRFNRIHTWMVSKKTCVFSTIVSELTPLANTHNFNALYTIYNFVLRLNIYILKSLQLLLSLTKSSTVFFSSHTFITLRSKQFRKSIAVFKATPFDFTAYSVPIIFIIIVLLLDNYFKRIIWLTENDYNI